MTRFVVDTGAVLHLVTLDADRARAAEEGVATAPIEALL
jgi:hypothetical protein